MSNSNNKNSSYINFLFKTKKGKSFLLEMIILLSLANFLTILIFLINFKKKISNIFEFNSLVFKLLGFTFFFPYKSFNENGFFIFRSFFISFVLILFHEIIRLQFDSKINKYKLNSEENQSSSKLILLKSFFLSIFISYINDLFREIIKEFDININRIMEMRMTLKIFIIINFLRGFFAGFKRISKIIDNLLKDKISNEENKDLSSSWKENLTYIHSLIVFTTIPNVLISAFIIFLNKFPGKFDFQIDITIKSINFILIQNKGTSLISALLFKLVIDFIDEFVVFNSNPKNNYKRFFQELFCLRNEDAAFNDFMKVFKKEEKLGITFEDFIKKFYQNDKIDEFCKNYKLYYEIRLQEFMTNENENSLLNSVDNKIKNFKDEFRKYLFDNQQKFYTFNDFFIFYWEKNFLSKEKLECLFESFMYDQYEKAKIKQQNQENYDEKFINFIKDFISENNKYEKTFENFEKLWKKELKPKKALKEIFIDKSPIPFTAKNALFCFSKSVITGLIGIAIYNVSYTSLIDFFTDYTKFSKLILQERIANCFTNYKSEIKFVLAFSIIASIIMKIINLQTSFIKKNHEEYNFQDKPGENFEIFGWTPYETFSKFSSWVSNQIPSFS